MSRLPVPGQDEGVWGDVLNDFLSQEHNADGSLKIKTDGTLAAKEVKSDKGQAGGYAPLDGSGKVPSANLPAASAGAPADGSVTDASITSGGLSPSKVTGTAVITTDSRLTDARTPSDSSVTDAKVAAGADIAQSKIQNLSSDLASKATDSAVVHKSTTETITGDKNFTGALTQNSQAVILANDTRLTDTRTPTDGSVTNAKVASGANIAVSKLAPGSDNQYLTVSAGAASWATVAPGSATGVPTVFNVKDAAYGAVGNGSTDDTTAINSAITAANAAGGGIVYLPAGTYRVATAIVGLSNIQIVGAGKGITVISLDDVAQYGISTNASVSASNSLLTADLNIGDSTATLASVSGFTAGSTVMLRASQTSFGAWVARVASVDGGTNTLTFDETSPLSLTVSDTGTVYRASVISNFRVAHLTIQSNTATPTLRNRLIFLNWTIGSEVDHVEMKYAAGTSAMAVLASNSRDIRILHCDADSIKADDTALSINAIKVTKLSIHDCTVRNSSAGVVLESCALANVANNRITGAGTASGGRGIKLLDGSNYSSIIGNTVADFATDHTAIRMSDSAYCSIIGNQVRNCGSGIDMNTDSSPNRALTKHNVVANNVMHNLTGWGILHEPNGATTTDMYNTITSNHMHNCSLGGVKIGTCGNAITNNTVVDYGSGKGVQINSSSQARNLISNNYVRNPTTPGSGAAIGSVGGNKIIGNDVGTETVSMAASDVHDALPDIVTLTYGTTIPMDPSNANNFKLTITDAAAHSFSAPTASRSGTGHRITIDVFNNSGGAAATATWSSAFKLAGSWVAPATGKHRLITFVYDGANWLEVARSAADV